MIVCISLTPHMIVIVLSSQDEILSKYLKSLDWMTL